MFRYMPFAYQHTTLQDTAPDQQQNLQRKSKTNIPEKTPSSNAFPSHPSIRLYT
jgi:hypothetical protein